ncbi:MAG: YihA family ribosome biogenesis GTP-binding protein [Bacilli bacterium]|nr:YihA family ribosome biogenesis GTP-binding protein [Bacilli bacterium]
MKIISVSEPIVAVRQSQYPDDKKPEFLLVGRSNVGKSSFINSIVERKDIARVSSNPGKTQTLNFYSINNDFYIVDVPGYGYANVSKEMQQKFGLMIEEYLANRDNLERVYMLVDFRIKPTNDDMLMYNFLKYHNLPVTIVMTKVDKVSRNDRDKNLNLIKNTLNVFEEDNMVLFSAKTKLGKSEIHNELEKIVYNKE